MHANAASLSCKYEIAWPQDLLPHFEGDTEDKDPHVCQDRRRFMSTFELLQSSPESMRRLWDVPTEVPPHTFSQLYQEPFAKDELNVTWLEKTAASALRVLVGDRMWTSVLHHIHHQVCGATRAR